MPTILREDGWAVFICTDDHLPPHVHVKRPGGYVKIHLNGPDGLPEVVKIVRVADHDAWRALAIVYRHQQLLLREWRDIHG
ncbi:MAG TPA: DUF4160 domain-containing protein [Longimicrobium sp.]|jgi:hypothetical protein|nr:DUF4160 domain-containing protein [Longimicrobium sp.]